MRAPETPRMQSRRIHLLDQLGRDLFLRTNLVDSSKTLSRRNLNQLCRATLDTMRARLPKNRCQSLTHENIITAVKQVAHAPRPHHVKSSIIQPHAPRRARFHPKMNWHFNSNFFVHRCRSKSPSATSSSPDPKQPPQS